VVSSTRRKSERAHDEGGREGRETKLTSRLRPHLLYPPLLPTLERFRIDLEIQILLLHSHHQDLSSALLQRERKRTRSTRRKGREHATDLIPHSNLLLPLPNPNLQIMLLALLPRPRPYMLRRVLPVP